jgi:hypothetical protein
MSCPSYPGRARLLSYQTRRAEALCEWRPAPRSDELVDVRHLWHAELDRE